jgi:hypothetical protein
MVCGLYACGQTAPLTNQPTLFEQKGAIPEIKLTRCADTPVIWTYSGEIWPITDENNQKKPPKPSYTT